MRSPFASCSSASGSTSSSGTATATSKLTVTAESRKHNRAKPSRKYSTKKSKVKNWKMYHWNLFNLIIITGSKSQQMNYFCREYRNRSSFYLITVDNVKGADHCLF